MSQDGWRMATNVVNSKSRLRFMITTPEKSEEDTVFENHRKSLIQHCNRSELHLHFEWTKKCQKGSNLVSFWKPTPYDQTELPDRSVLIGGKCENSKIQMRQFGWFSNNVLLNNHFKYFYPVSWVFFFIVIMMGWCFFAKRHLALFSSRLSRCALWL